MNALEAKSYGFVDEVLGDVEDLLTLKNIEPEVLFSNANKA